LFISSCLAACGPGRSAGSGSDTDESDGEASESESDTTSEGGETDECRLAIRLDQCCNQPFAATVEEIEAELCVAEWPVDWGSLPEEVATECTMAQPDWCEVVDCDYAQPASDMVGPDGEGGCQYLCPEETYPAYRNPGCEQPVVECLGVPPPCADEYCTCEGETIYGCGQVGEPFEHIGPCE
jgi:hypothetical protein